MSLFKWKSIGDLKHTQFIEIHAIATFVSNFNVSINHYYRKTLTPYLKDNIFSYPLEIILNRGLG